MKIFKFIIFIVIIIIIIIRNGAKGEREKHIKSIHIAKTSATKLPKKISDNPQTTQNTGKWKENKNKRKGQCSAPKE